MKKIILAALLAVSLSASAQQLGNLSGTLLSSSARTATSVVTPDQTNPQWRGGHFIINVSAYTRGTYTPTIQAKDPASGTYYPILIGSAISSTGTTVLKVYPGITAVANGATSDILPRTWRLSFAGTSTPTMTFGVGMFLEQ